MCYIVSIVPLEMWELLKLINSQNVRKFGKVIFYLHEFDKGQKFQVGE